MTVQELSSLCEAEILNPQAGAQADVQYGYCCDLLSWVMSHGAEGTAWITVMTHMNAVAVATLLEFSCVMLPEGIRPEEAVLEKATEEGLCILASKKTAYELSGLLYGAGIPAPQRG